VHRVQQWLALHWEKGQLADAKAKSDAAAAALAVQHNALDAKVEEQKEKSPDLAHHTKKNKDATPIARIPASQKSQEESAALLKKTEEIAEKPENAGLSRQARRSTQRTIGNLWPVDRHRYRAAMDGFSPRHHRRADHPGDRASSPVFQHVD